MALERFAYRDPFLVVSHREHLEQKQDAACGTCKHRLFMRWQGRFINRCALKKRYGKRCLNYRQHAKLS